MSSPSLQEFVHSPHTGTQFGAQLARVRYPAARQRPDHKPIGWTQICYHPVSGVPKLAGYPVSVDRIADGFGDDESDAR